MNFYKKYKLFKSFKRILKENRVSIESNFNIKVDRANRMYTVLNIPDEYFVEPYNLRKGDIEIISEKYIKDFLVKLRVYLTELGLSELYDFYEPIKKVNKYSYLIVLGFKQFNSVNYMNALYYRVYPIIVLILISLFIYLFS